MTTKTRKIKFNANVVRFNDVHGNTYHSVKITRNRDGKQIVSGPMVYGYGEHYRQTALELMAEKKWLPVAYRGPATHFSKIMDYERENNYPIAWNVFDGLKRDMINNVI